EPAADVLERGGNDLDVEQGDEHARAHHHEGQDRGMLRRGGGHGARPSSLVSTRTTVERPGRSIASLGSPGSSATRTGTRCTILVKSPVAFSAGMTLKIAPVPGARLTTWAWKTWPGRISAVTVADWPGVMRAS